MCKCLSWYPCVCTYVCVWVPMFVCVCVCCVCISERIEINPMLSPIPGYEFTASVWPSHCLNNNLINPVFISFSELGRQAGRAWGKTGNAGRIYWKRGRKPSARTGIWEEFKGRDLSTTNGNRDVKRLCGRIEILSHRGRTSGTKEDVITGKQWAQER